MEVSNILFYKSFLINVSILITCSYLFNLGYKIFLQNANVKVKTAVIVCIFIFAGWLTMVFGVRGSGFTLFDLRAVPIIFGTLLFRDPRLLLVIGVGIASARYSITGFTPQAFTGSINIMLLSTLAAFLVSYYKKVSWSYRKKAIISILSINTLQVMGISIFGSVPTDYYLLEVAPYVYPTGILMSSFFVFIIRDFYKEQQRAEQLHQMNITLRQQTRELSESKEQLEEKARQLMQASRFKSEFIANMSHELKTPLNSIIVLSQMIVENEDDPKSLEDKRYADIINKSGNDLLHMINDILDLSKIEAGKMDVMLDMIVMEEMVQMLTTQFKPLMDQKNVRFEVMVSPDVPDVITSDIQKLNQILRNLIMNAIKFTEKGTITLLLQADSPQTISFTIRDTGIGIDPEKHKQIFLAFQQEDGATNRKYGGTGLGLSISLQLSKLLGGTLTLESEKGVGSQFTLHLPVHSS
ncbi:MAG: integral rane sensor hybrid histidine kinase [Paenibacillus sp.]|jgi:two-component system chemotaxis sensor kinase CheA|nr:integral rane sensor hybrid histidine kinase [Paenibacillus sp.]